jgi:hypothetical protein
MGTKIAATATVASYTIGRRVFDVMSATWTDGDVTFDVCDQATGTPLHDGLLADAPDESKVRAMLADRADDLAARCLEPFFQGSEDRLDEVVRGAGIQARTITPAAESAAAAPDVPAATAGLFERVFTGQYDSDNPPAEYWQAIELLTSAGYDTADLDTGGSPIGGTVQTLLMCALKLAPKLTAGPADTDPCGAIGTRVTVRRTWIDGSALMRGDLPGTVIASTLGTDATGGRDQWAVRLDAGLLVSAFAEDVHVIDTEEGTDPR